MEKSDANWKKLIVRVFAKTPEGEKYRGTAFLVNEQTLLTARHVIEPFRVGFDKDKDLIVLRNGPWDGDQYLAQAPIPHDDPKIDIALLRLRMPNQIAMRYWPFQDDPALIGKRVRIAGFDNEKDPSTAPSFEVCGEISRYSTLTLQEKVQHGKSGGPVLIGARIVGILYARTDAPDSREDQNQTFIYPFCVFQDFLAEQGVRTADSHGKAQSGLRFRNCEERVALIDRQAQWDEHIEVRIRTDQARNTFAFVVAGVKEEWPESLKYRLQRHLQVVMPCQITLRMTQGLAENWEHVFWTHLLGHLREADYAEETEPSILRSKLIRELSASPSPRLFYWNLDPTTSPQLELIQKFAKAWESLEIPDSLQQHFLLLVYGSVEKEKGLASLVSALTFRGAERKVDGWWNKLKRMLADDGPRMLTPKLDSPSRDEINYWSSTCLDDMAERIRFDAALAKLKGKKIPHRTLLKTYFEIAPQKGPVAKP